MRASRILVAFVACAAFALHAVQAQAPDASPPCSFGVYGPKSSAPGGVHAGQRLNAGPHQIWISPRGADGRLGPWRVVANVDAKLGDKYLVQIRDGDPPTATWIANDARLGQYPAPAGVAVPYFEIASQREWGIAVCPAAGATPPPPPVVAGGPPCSFMVVGPTSSAPGGVHPGPRLNAGPHQIWISPRGPDGKLGAWRVAGAFEARLGNKYLVQIRDGLPATALANDARLGQYSAPVGMAVPYFENATQRDYGVAVCPTAGTGVAGSGAIVIGTSRGFDFGFALPGGKLLTYSGVGATNTTVTKIDGQAAELGANVGKTVEAGTKTSDGGVRSTWVANGVRFTQTLVPVTSATGVRDAVLVRWSIRNEDTRPRTVGLRTQIDTLIGANDGVPFMAPGLPGLVQTSADFPKQGPVPAYVQALENPDLRNPGVVAHVTLQVRGVEPPDRVSLTHWPAGNLNWEIPVEPMGSDSALVLYWNERPLSPGASRDIGFTYGLGAVASAEGRVGVTAAVGAASGHDFPVTAYVRDAKPNETATLDPPAGVVVRGERTVAVPLPPAESKDRTSVVTWTASAAQPGAYEMVIRTSAGDLQRQVVNVAPSDGPAPPAIGSADLNALLAELRDADPAMRLKAAKVLGRMGAAATDALPALRTATEDTDADVRRVAADSVRAIEAAQPRPEATAKWIADLRNPDEAIRLRAAKTLGQLGLAARDAAPALQAATQDADPDVRRVAAESLRRVRGDDAPRPPAEIVVPPQPLNAPVAFTFKARIAPVKVNAVGGIDSDYFTLTFEPGRKVDLALVGDGSTDVDLWAHDATGKLLVKEIGLTDQEKASFVAEKSPHPIEVRNIGKSNNVCTLRVTTDGLGWAGHAPLAIRRNLPANEIDVLTLPFEGGKQHRIVLKSDGSTKLALTATTPDGAETVATAMGDLHTLTLALPANANVRLTIRNAGDGVNRYALLVGQ